MKTSVTVAMAIVFIVFTVFPFASWAQDTAAGNDNAQPNVAHLFEDLSKLAEQLTENISGVKQAIVTARESSDAGAKLIDQVQESIELITTSLAEDGDIWAELTRTQEIWEEKRLSALEKSETDIAFKAISEAWGTKLDEAAKLRKQILLQRAESMALLDQIASQKEIMLAYYELGQADKALEKLREVSDVLGEMNENMRAIVDQAGQVAGPAVAQ